MKLLIYDWNFITKLDVYNSIIDYGIEIELFNCEFSPRNIQEKEKYKEKLQEFIKHKQYDAFFSINFFEEFAYIANNENTMYICWTYDSPALGSNIQALKLNTNRIFVFDSSEYFEYKSYGIDNIYYLPLAVNTTRLNNIILPPMEKLKYYSEISFVGQLYQSDMDKIFPLFDEYSAGYIAAIINSQLSIHNKNIIKELINPKILEKLFNDDVKQALIDNLNDDFYHNVQEMGVSNTISFLLKAVTNKERVVLLSLLAKYHRVKLYTKDNCRLPGVNNFGIVDYNREMPMVFKASKINLNITLRTIRAGIPQRVLDILGCRALALTNEQEDMKEYFEDHKNILIYQSIEEALDKCKYYLKNDSKAEKIRQNGYKLVKDKFSFKHQLRQIWEICGMNGEIKENNV